MRILDEISTYNNYYSYDGLTAKIKEINERENRAFLKSYQGIPILTLENEK